MLCSIIGTGVRALGALAGSERAISRMLIGGLLMSMPTPPPPFPIPGGGRRVRLGWPGNEGIELTNPALTSQAAKTDMLALASSSAIDSGESGLAALASPTGGDSGGWAAFAIPTGETTRVLFAILTLIAAGVLHRLFRQWRHSGMRRARFTQFTLRSHGLPDLTQMPHNAAAACAEMWVTFDSLRARGVCKAAPVVTTPERPGGMPKRNRSYSALAALAEDEALEAHVDDEAIASIGRRSGSRPQLPVLPATRRVAASADGPDSPTLLLARARPEAVPGEARQ